LSNAFDQLIWQTAGRHGVEPQLVKAIGPRPEHAKIEVDLRVGAHGDRTHQEGSCFVSMSAIPPRTGVGVSANSDRPCRPTTVQPVAMPTAEPNSTSLRK